MYYVYELIDHRDGTVFYVGKGSGNRKDVHVQKVKRGEVSENRFKDKVIRDIYAETGKYPESVIVETFECEDTAYLHEEKLIEKYGTYKDGGILTNICKDAKPPCHKGRKRSAETRAKLADRCGEKNPAWGRKHTAEWKRAASERNSGENNHFYGKKGKNHPVSGYKHSHEECEKRRQRSSGKYIITTPEGIRKEITNLSEYSRSVGVPNYIIRSNSRGWECSRIA